MLSTTVFTIDRFVLALVVTKPSDVEALTADSACAA
jgi:hypothetical protein